MSMLYHDFWTNDKKTVHKHLHYFPVYERHFSKFINQSIVFWEIGVNKGGSLQMWKRFFGPFAQIVGIDIEPECKVHEEDQVVVCIGDQSDPIFLQEVIDKYGVPDVVLDDGSHEMAHVCATFEFLYDKVSKNGVYMVEDMHTSYWPVYGGGLKKEGTFIELCKSLIDLLNARHYGMPGRFTETTFSVCFYDSIVAFDKKQWHGNTFKSIMIPPEPISLAVSGEINLDRIIRVLEMLGANIDQMDAAKDKESCQAEIYLKTGLAYYIQGDCLSAADCLGKARKDLDGKEDATPLLMMHDYWRGFFADGHIFEERLARMDDGQRHTLEQMLWFTAMIFDEIPKQYLETLSHIAKGMEITEDESAQLDEYMDNGHTIAT